MSFTTDLKMAYHMGYDDALAKRNPDASKVHMLGRGECHNASKVMDEHGQARFACSECGAWIDSRMLWNPEYRNGESPWVSGCKLNFCPNCGRRIVAPTTNDVDAEVDA